MRVSGFTFVRNMVRMDYPIVESINSVLPVVDEFIVNVGDSEDGTLELIRSIPSGKIRIVESVWPKDMKRDGLVLAQQANIAFEACTGDWAFYIQADEVVHERDLPRLVELMERNLHEERVLGLMFRYLHFYLDYWTTDPWGYRNEVRVVKNNGVLEVIGDACGFGWKARGGHLDKHNLGREVIHTGVPIYHYGWVRPGDSLAAKLQTQEELWRGYLPREERESHWRWQNRREGMGQRYGWLKEFRGTHPRLMRERVSSFPRFCPRRSRWLNPKFYREVLRHGFKG